MRQAGLIPKKCPFKGDSLKSSTVPETDNTSHQDINTTSQAEQRGAATGSRDTAGVEDMEIGVVEEVTTTLLGRHGRKRSSSGRWIRNTQSHASESIAVSTETDLTGTSLSMPAQSGSESGLSHIPVLNQDCHLNKAPQLPLLFPSLSEPRPCLHSTPWPRPPRLLPHPPPTTTPCTNEPWPTSETLRACHKRQDPSRPHLE